MSAHTTPRPRPEADDRELLDAVSVLVHAGQLELLNARGEHACNSSSSHSVIVLPRAGEFHREYWEGDDLALTSSTEKLRYLAASLARVPGAGEVRDAVGALSSTWNPEDYAGPQSGGIHLPRSVRGGIEGAGVELLTALMSHPQIAVSGYDDSGGYPDLEGEELSFLRGRWKVRRDEIPGQRPWWVVFCPEDGTKLRLRVRSQDHPLAQAPVVKAPAPELVDVKLTDACPFELSCGMCYMGSTRDGKPADPGAVMGLVAALAELGVMEIAFGGGEPTLWPGFGELLAFCRQVGVVGNFTTKNVAGLAKHPEWLDHAGAVAVSVTDAQSFRQTRAALAQMHSWQLSRQVSIQVIPEILDEALFEEILAWCARHDLRVTLLGYKTTGRGGTFQGRVARDPGWWIEQVRAHPGLRVAVDTVLAAESQEALQGAGVPEWCYHTEEGKFSMYVDAVTSRCGASSYVEPAELDEIALDTPTLTEALRERFARY